MEAHQQMDTTILIEPPPPPPPPPPRPPTTTSNQSEIQEQTTSSSSIVSSPTHEFSFTISLHSAATTTPSSPKHHKSPSSTIVDLTPADDIFFHGHLLPLHFLSHLHHATASSSSPRSSTTSRDSFNQPKPDPKPKPAVHSFPQDRPSSRPKPKSSSFSLSGLAKWIKGSSNSSSSELKESKSRMAAVKFDVAQFVKRYLKLMKIRTTREHHPHHHHHHHQHESYSFSGSLSPRISKREVGILRGELFSAPASMRTSPTNSGRLVARTGVPSPVSESTMEELQSAIQAAIAHCKKSTTTTTTTTTTTMTTTTAVVQQDSLGLSTSPVTVN